MTEGKIKIIFTGGHASSTAYSLITHIIGTGKKWDMFWIGPKSFVEGQSIKSLEEDEFGKLGVKYFSINAGRLQRKFTRWTIPSLFKIPQGLIQAFLLLIKLKPDIVFSFGGFVGFPVVLASYILRIPVIVHEQTVAAGRANIASAKFAKAVALARESSKKYFSSGNIIVTGNPIDTATLKIKNKVLIGKPPVIFVTGGHTGSVVINNNVVGALPMLLKHYKVVHQTGKIDHSRFIKFKKDLSPELTKKYIIYDIIEPVEFTQNLAEADIIISRAGANTVSKIMLIKRPSILIPIPYSYLNEQLLNAEYARDFGIAVILEEKDLNEITLIDKIGYIEKNWTKMVSGTSSKKSPDLDAADKLISLIEKYV